MLPRSIILKSVIAISCFALLAAAFLDLRGYRLVPGDQTQSANVATNVVIATISTTTPNVATTTGTSTVPVIKAISTATLPTITTKNPIIIPPAPAVIPTSTATIQPISITAKSIVGLQCYFNVATGSLLNSYTGPDPSQVEFQSTGVIINPAGYILTAKHVVDQTWAAQVYDASSTTDQILYSDLVFDHCDVGVPPTDVIPSSQEIEELNPTEALGPMHYTAKAYFDPSKGGMSSAEFQKADFAILKINGAAQYCSSSYRDCAFSGPFPYSPVLLSSTPPIGVQLLSYGYPVEASEDYYFQMFLKGSVGHLTSYDDGDAYFKNTPFTLNMKADDVMGGRSGSPIYWNGYVTGILYERSTEVQSSTAIGIPAIQKVLEDNGMGDLLKTQ